jgi:hypothetical protein
VSPNNPNADTQSAQSPAASEGQGWQVASTFVGFGLFDDHDGDIVLDSSYDQLKIPIDI